MLPRKKREEQKTRLAWRTEDQRRTEGRREEDGGENERRAEQRLSSKVYLQIWQYKFAKLSYDVMTVIYFSLMPCNETRKGTKIIQMNKYIHRITTSRLYAGAHQSSLILHPCLSRLM